MKIDKKLLQNKTDSFVIHARELSSRGASFLILMLGVLLQASHTTLLMYNIAGFDSKIIKGLVAFGIGIFISGALAIFTLKSDGKNKDINQIINVFFYFEIFTNIFYFWNSLIFIKGFENAVMQDWLYLIIAMPFAYIMPFTIKRFAGAIRTDESLKFGTIDILPSADINSDEVENLDEIIKDKINNKINDLDLIKRGETLKVKVNDKEGEIYLKKENE